MTILHGATLAETGIQRHCAQVSSKNFNMLQGFYFLVLAKAVADFSSINYLYLPDGADKAVDNGFVMFLYAVWVNFHVFHNYHPT